MLTAPLNHITLDERSIAYIAGTRIKVSHLAVERNVWKKSPEAIQMDFPQLTLGQIYSAFAYYCDHQEQIHAEVSEETQLTEQLRSKQFAPLTRKALLERLQKQAVGEVADFANQICYLPVSNRHHNENHSLCTYWLLTMKRHCAIR